MAGPVKKSVKIFYDVVSPYSWIGFETLCRYRTKWPIELKLKPMFLGGVMQDSGNQPPGMVPRKAHYMGSDLIRLRELYKIPINQLSNPAEVLFVKGTLKTQRFLTAIDMKYPKYLEEASRQLWLRIWNKDEDITEPQSLKEAGMKAGLSESEAEDAVNVINEPSVKEMLKTVTKEACGYGAFGAPTIVVEGTDGKEHMVFGSDRLEIIAKILGEKYYGPLAELSKL